MYFSSYPRTAVNNVHHSLSKGETPAILARQTRGENTPGTKKIISSRVKRTRKVGKKSPISIDIDASHSLVTNPRRVFLRMYRRADPIRTTTGREKSILISPS